MKAMADARNKRQQGDYPSNGTRNQISCCTATCRWPAWTERPDVLCLGFVGALPHHASGGVTAADSQFIKPTLGCEVRRYLPLRCALLLCAAAIFQMLTAAPYSHQTNECLPGCQVQLSQHPPSLKAAQAVWAAAALAQPGAIQAAGEQGYARLQALLEARAGTDRCWLFTVGWHSHDLRSVPSKPWMYLNGPSSGLMHASAAVEMQLTRVAWHMQWKIAVPAVETCPVSVQLRPRRC